MIHSDVSKEDSEDDDDEDSNDDDVDNDEDEKPAVRTPSQSDHRIYTALSDFKGEQEGDLSVQVKYPCSTLAPNKVLKMSSTGDAA